MATSDILDIASIADPLFGAGYQPLKAVTGGCGGKEKPKPWARMPGGILTYRGKRLLAAGRELLPETLDLQRAAAEGYGDLYRDEAAKTREDELDAFEEMGPRYVEAIQAADPLRARVNEIALANLDEGLDPAMRREIQQGTREAYSSRGMLETPASAIEELFRLGYAGHRLEAENLDRALAITRGTDPFLAFAGRPSAPQGSNIMSPDYGSYSNDLPSFQANAELQRFNASQAAKDRRNQLIAAGIGAAGDLGGGALSFI